MLPYRFDEAGDECDRQRLLKKEWLRAAEHPWAPVEPDPADPSAEEEPPY